MTVRRHACAQGLVEAARWHAGPVQQAVVSEMGAPPTGLPAVVKRRIETWVQGVETRTVSRSLETRGANAQGSRETARGEVTQRPENTGKKNTQEGLTTAAT